MGDPDGIQLQRLLALGPTDSRGPDRGSYSHLYPRLFLLCHRPQHRCANLSLRQCRGHPLRALISHQVYKHKLPQEYRYMISLGEEQILRVLNAIHILYILGFCASIGNYLYKQAFVCPSARGKRHMLCGGLEHS